MRRNCFYRCRLSDSTCKKIDGGILYLGRSFCRCEGISAYSGRQAMTVFMLGPWFSIKKEKENISASRLFYVHPSNADWNRTGFSLGWHNLHKKSLIAMLMSNQCKTQQCCLLAKLSQEKWVQGSNSDGEVLGHHQLYLTWVLETSAWVLSWI